MFSRKLNPSKTGALALYRQCIRVIKRLKPEHQKLWYDYTRLKYSENSQLKDMTQIKKKIADAKEELAWVESVVSRKEEVINRANNTRTT